MSLKILFASKINKTCAYQHKQQLKSISWLKTILIKFMFLLYSILSNIILCIFPSFSFSYQVPRKVLKDRYDTAPEPDEPQQIDLEQDQDDLYDDDQFYRENEAIPPAPKLQGGPNKNKFSDISTVATLAGFDIIDRIKGDDNNLEGM